MKTRIEVESHYGNLKSIIMLGERVEGIGNASCESGYVVSSAALARANRNGSGDYYDRTVDGEPVVGR